MSRRMRKRTPDASWRCRCRPSYPGCRARWQATKRQPAPPGRSLKATIQILPGRLRSSPARATRSIQLGVGTCHMRGRGAVFAQLAPPVAPRQACTLSHCPLAALYSLGPGVAARSRYCEPNWRRPAGVGCCCIARSTRWATRSPSARLVVFHPACASCVCVCVCVCVCARARAGTSAQSHAHATEMEADSTDGGTSSRTHTHCSWTASSDSCRIMAPTTASAACPAHTPSPHAPSPPVASARADGAPGTEPARRPEPSGSCCEDHESCSWCGDKEADGALGSLGPVRPP